MRFIDEVVIDVGSGHGGSGSCSFRREKFAEYGGPDGGDGGRGGHVTIVGDENLNTLLHFRGIKRFYAEDGQNGMGSQMNGKAGKDLVLKVPPGTIIRNHLTDEIVADITEHGQELVIAKGGMGGKGNLYYQSSTNQAPTKFQPGEEGQQFELKLELKLLADIGLVGLPNAGKSTLIAAISSARPKIADYPFTTLEPNLGVVKVNDKTLVVADIPGLIEDASEGKGLGVKFLKHIERTSALVHLVDCSMLIDEYEAMESYMTVRKELLKYSENIANKKEIICLTKIDAMTEEEIARFQKFMEEQLDKKVLPISGVSGRNIEILKQLMLKTKELNAKEDSNGEQ